MQNLWRVPALARRFRFDGERDDIGREWDLCFRQLQPRKRGPRLLRIFEMLGLVRMIMLQSFKDFGAFHLSFGGDESNGAFVERFAVERRAIGDLAEGLGCLVIMLLRQPCLTDAEPKQNRVLAAGEKRQEGDFRLPELAPIKRQVGQPELGAGMTGRCGKHLAEGDACGSLPARLVKFETLFVDKSDTARVKRAAEIITRAGAKQRAAQLLLFRPEKIFIGLVATEEVVGPETLLDCPPDAMPVQHEAGEGVFQFSSRPVM